jgi:hypothetical protein
VTVPASGRPAGASLVPSTVPAPSELLETATAP